MKKKKKPIKTWGNKAEEIVRELFSICLACCQTLFDPRNRMPLQVTLEHKPGISPEQSWV